MSRHQQAGVGVGDGELPLEANVLIDFAKVRFLRAYSPLQGRTLRT